jgi:hypothetical protein
VYATAAPSAEHERRNLDRLVQALAAYRVLDAIRRVVNVVHHQHCLQP